MSYIMMALGWVLRLCSDLTGNYGFSIIIFTILIKAVLLPLSIKQQRSMLKTQKLQPLLAELQHKYGNDKEKLNQETIKLYQKYQINPMSGCLPLLIQLPILIMLYSVVRGPIVYIMGFGKDEVWRIVSAIVEWSETNPDGLSSFLSALGIDSLDKLTENSYKMFGIYEIQIARFLHLHPEILESGWITELGRNFNVINFDFFGLDLSQTPNLGAFFGLFMGRISGLSLGTVLLWIIPLLSGLSSYITSKLTQTQTNQPVQTGENANPMKGMMVIMPLMSAWFAFTLPAAIGLYWIISNVLTLIQQFLLNRVINPGITEDQIEGEVINAKKNRKKRKK